MRGTRLWWIVALGAAVARAFALRLARLGAEPFWLDEICTHDFSGGAVESVLEAWAQDVHPPLCGLLLHGWQTMMGTSERALRGYSAVWVGFEDGRLPPPGSTDADLVAWLATTGPYRYLGKADGFALHAPLVRVRMTPALVNRRSA